MEKNAMKERIWLKGDTHLHTKNSDGKLTKGQLVEKCKKLGLDFAILTDHNYNSVSKTYFDGDLLVIQGQEITGDPGHINVWGKKVPAEPPYVLETEADYQQILAACRKAGATLCVNHPFCSNCGFHMDLESFDFDCVEVWNTIQHSDNIKNMDWWEGQLLKGNRIAAVGGSDFHKDYVLVLKLLANPTTIVHARSKSEADVLAALREGRSVITNKPNTSMLYLSCGSAGLGDTVSWKPGIKACIEVTKFKKGHTLRIYNNEKVIYEIKNNKQTDIFRTDFEVAEPGFIRAELRYTFDPLMKKLYQTAESKFLHADIADLPAFFWAFTNPIWFE